MLDGPPVSKRCSEEMDKKKGRSPIREDSDVGIGETSKEGDGRKTAERLERGKETEERRNKNGQAGRKETALTCVSVL